MSWVYDTAIGDLNWFSTIIFIVLPVASVVILFLVKRRFLWTAPIISTLLSVAMAAMVEPSMLTYHEYRSMFFGIVIPMQLVAVVILTILAYMVGYLLKRAAGK